MGDDRCPPRRRGDAWVLAQIPLLAAALLGPVVERAVRPRTPWSRVPAAVTRAVGVIGMLCSVMMVRQAARNLGSGFVPYPGPVESAVLRQSGIYGVIRHPIYVAILCGIVSWSVLWRSRFGLALLGPSIVFFRSKSRYEEELLLARFPDYQEYRRRTPAFIPRLRAR